MSGIQAEPAAPDSDRGFGELPETRYLTLRTDITHAYEMHPRLKLWAFSLRSL